MTARLALRGIARGKARFLCAVAGVAAAVGAVTFVFSLAATYAAQAPALARRACAPWGSWRFAWAKDGGKAPAPPESGGRAAAGSEGRAAPESEGRAAPESGGYAAPESGGHAAPGSGGLALQVVALTIDFRPEGKVLQGPPMRAIAAEAPASSPWGVAPLAEGAWPDHGSDELQFVCTRGTLTRFGRGEPPPIGSPVKFVGMRGTATARVVGYLEEAKLPPGWPTAFFNAAAFRSFSREPHGTLVLSKEALREHAPHANGEMLSGPNGEMGVWLGPESEAVVAAFTGDENRRMDYARPLLFAAAVLTALALLVNTLLLSVEANRRPLALLRTAGMTRGGVVRLVAAESMLAALAGWGAGSSAAVAALWAWVVADPMTFPVGPALSWKTFPACAAGALAVGAIALAFALRPALSVRPLDALAAMPRRRRRGMAVAFAFGFGAFVAVEVWGASLMRGFVPSPEWPDAIVSVLPGGFDPIDRPKLDGLTGVKRISELYPLQLPFEPELPMRRPGEAGGRNAAQAAKGAPVGRGGPGGPGGRGGWMLRNVLFLGAEWLPRFAFVEGTWEEASEAVFGGRACVLSEMVARAYGLHRGDVLRVASGGGRAPKTIHELPIAGVVDVNWHMVTSRGLVRGLNGAPVMTDGAAFVSLDTVGTLDPRPMLSFVPATHLWVEYEPDFLAERGVFPAGRMVEREIDEALGRPADATVRLHARDEISDGTLAHGNDLIGQAARVPFAFLAILSLGFVAMLVADADAARRELVVLRAVGATRAQLAKRLAGGALRTALAGMAAGLPGGATAGWLFSIRTASLWPGMPHHIAVPWRVLAEGAVGSVAFVLAVAVPTSLVLVAKARRAESL